MAISVCEVSITNEPLDLPAPDEDLQAGAVVVFWGAVRATEDGREITGIEYEAHREMAEHQMRIVAEGAAVSRGTSRRVSGGRVTVVLVGVEASRSPPELGAAMGSMCVSCRRGRWENGSAGWSEQRKAG
jgi:hypothetical protein